MVPASSGAKNGLGGFDEERPAHADPYTAAGNDVTAGGSEEGNRKGRRNVSAGSVGPPTDVRAMIVSTRFITLAWDQPESNNLHITGYSVFYQQEGSER